MPSSISYPKLHVVFRKPHTNLRINAVKKINGMCSFYPLQIIMPRLGWRWLVGFSLMPPLGVLLASFAIPESPRFLCVKGRTTEAQNILETVAKLNGEKLPPGIITSDRRRELVEEHSSSENSPLLSSASEKKKHSSNSFSQVLTLFSPELIRITLPLWFCFFSNLFLYYGIILLTSQLSGENICSMSNQLPAKKPVNLYINVFITSLAGI